MVSWVDDIIAVGCPEDVDQMNLDLKDAFNCKSKGGLKEYMGSKIDITRNNDGLGTVKVTQPVLVQKLEDEFDLPSGKAPRTPASAGQVLVRGDGSGAI